MDRLRKLWIETRPTVVKIYEEGRITAEEDDKIGVFMEAAVDRIARLEAALGSIAANTCCGRCQEAALVAIAALLDEKST